MMRQHSHSDAVQCLVSGIKDGLRETWWPALMRLRPAYSREGVRLLVRSAVDLGKLLGLDPREEEARHTRSLKTRCSWWVCSHSTARNDHDFVLPTCKGCGEVRYCSRDCQKRWAYPRSIQPAVLLTWSHILATGLLVDIRQSVSV